MHWKTYSVLIDVKTKMLETKMLETKILETKQSLKLNNFSKNKDHFVFSVKPELNYSASVQCT